MRISKALLLATLLALNPLSAEETKVYVPPIYDISVPEELKLAPESLKISLPENDPVTLDEAVALSLATHESLTEAQAAIDQAIARVAQSRAGAQPQISANINHTKPLYYNIALPAGLSTGADSGALAFFTNAAEGPSQRLIISQLIYDFNRTRSAVKAAESRTKAAEFAMEVTRHRLIYEISVAYVDLLQKQSLAKVQMLTVENQSLHVEEARKLHGTGLGLPIDVVRAQTALANAVQEFSQTRNRALLARVSLAALMGIDPRTPFKVLEPGAPDELDRTLDSLIQQALANRPGLQQSKSLLTAQQYTVKNAEAGNRPRLSTSLNFVANQVLPQPASENLSLMLNLEIPVFDGGLTKAQTKEAEAGLVSAQAQLSLLERQVLREVTNSYIERQNAVQKLRNVKFEVEGAQESVRVASGRYRLGLGRFIEVLDAEQALATARTNQVNARTQLSLAHASMKLAVGDGVLSKSITNTSQTKTEDTKD